MTTRHAAYLVTLAEDMREDDAEETLTMQRFEVYCVGRHPMRVGIRCNRCLAWDDEVEDFATLAELVQRADEHAEVCR